MYISTKDWLNYIKRLSELNNTAGTLMRDYVAKHGFADTKAIIDYAYALVTKYGEGSAALSAEMYDAVAEMTGKIIPAAEVANTASYREIAKAVYGTLKTSKNPESYANIANRYVKRAGADTTLKNAERDGAQFAWVPMGDTCSFCLTLASRGWQTVSKKTLKNGHAEHIHANCDCAYTVRFDSKSGVRGYNPDKYLAMYKNAEGDTPQEKINAMRRMQYQDPATRNKINAQKREAYAARTIEQERKNRQNDFSINKAVVDSNEYKEKFATITTDNAVNEKIYDKSLDILYHRNGTDYEDMHLISVVDGKVKGSQTKVEYYDRVSEELRHNHVWYNESLESAVKNNPQNTLISIHNHSGNKPPSGGDFESQFTHRYKGGVISCHNGDLYYYEVGKKRFTGTLYDMTVDKYIKQGYSESEAYIKTLDQFVEDFGIKWRRL